MQYRWQTTKFADLEVDELHAVLQLRQEVFVVEQQCIYLDLDGKDDQATHMMCWHEQQLLAAQRCLGPGVSYPESSLGRIVVSPRARGLQLGRELVQRGIDYNLRRWPDSDIQIGAQSYLRQFYTSLGFTVVGQEYEEDGIMHVHMLYVRSPAGK